MRPLGLAGDNHDTKIDSPVRAAAFMLAGGPGTVDKLMLIYINGEGLFTAY